MAETKIGPIFRGANGGLSDDLFTGVKNSFFYSNNIEIREDANSIYPKKLPFSGGVDLGLQSTVGTPDAVLYFNSNWYVFGKNNVYKIDLGAGTSTGLMGWMVSEQICDAELFDGYVYISTTNHLYRISQYASDSSWANSSNFDTMTLITNARHPLYATNTILAVGNKNKVNKVTKEIPNQLQDGIELQSDYQVRFINELGGFLRITASDGYYGAEILLWDKISLQPNEVIPMSGYKFLESCVYNGYHYLLSDKGLGLVNGYQYYILKRTEDTTRVYTNGMVVYDDKLTFVNVNGLYIYGAKNKNYRDVLNMWTNYGTPLTLGTDGEDLVYVFQRTESDDKAHIWFWMHNYSDLSHGNAGEFQTMAYFGESMAEIKQAMYLKLGYSLDSEMQVYYRTEADARNNDPNDWAWHELTPKGGLRKNQSDMRSPFATTLKLNCRFQWIQFKFILRQSPSQSSGYTKLYSADLYYNTMLD